MHLKSVNVKFSSYQKMLRQVSFNHYPNIEIKNEAVIGRMGSTGNSEGAHVHLHLQIELRDEKGNIIVLDPARVLRLPCQENESAGILTKEEFKNQLTDEYWKSTSKARWEYMNIVISELKRCKVESVLEIGTNGIVLTDFSDVLEIKDF
jgi:hypothetical protein